MDDVTAKFELVAEPGEVVRVIREVGRSCDAATVAPRDARRLELCLEELLTNLATHGVPASSPPRAWVVLSVAPESLALEIEDDGPAFDPLAQPAADLSESVEDRPVGGLGVHVVRSLVDGVCYRRVHGRNQLSLSLRRGKR